MVISTRKNKLVSFVFKTFNNNGAVRVNLALAGGFVERGLKVDVVVLKKEGKGLNWLPPNVRVVELKENIRVIYNPVVTPELLEKAKEPLDHPWFARGEPPVILGVGRLHLQKDFPTLIRAFALVRQHKPTRLMLLGEGPDRYKLEALIDELGLTNEIALPGFISNPYAFISKASVFVLSSLYEGLPTVLIEAIAVGTVIVSTDCPSGPAEILDSGKYGCLVPVGDIKALSEAILNTLDQPTDSEALRQRAQQFSYETAVNKYLELLKI